MQALTLLLCLAFAYPAIAQSSKPAPTESPKKQGSADSLEPKISNAKAADIRKLMELAGTTTLVNQMMAGMEENVKPMVSNSLPPGEYRERLVDYFFEKFNQKASAPQLLELIVPIYDKYYTHEEIRGLMEFYQTPLGKKMLATLPQLVADSQAIGQKWGADLGQESMKEVLAEHPDLAKALEAATKGD